MLVIGNSRGLDGVRDEAIHTVRVILVNSENGFDGIPRPRRKVRRHVTTATDQLAFAVDLLIHLLSGKITVMLTQSGGQCVRIVNVLVLVL